MATTDELVLRIKRRISRKADIPLDTDIIAELSAAQERLEGKPTLPDFLVVTADLDVVGAHEAFSFNTITGFLRLHDDFKLSVLDTSADPSAEPYAMIKREEYDTLISRKLGTATNGALPTHYSVVGRSVFLRPRMTDTRKYRFAYYRRAPTLPGVGITTLWSQNMPDLLTADTGKQIARSLRDPEAYALFAQDWKEAYADFVKSQGSAEMMGRELVMGDD